MMDARVVPPAHAPPVAGIPQSIRESSLKIMTMPPCQDEDHGTCAGNYVTTDGAVRYRCNCVCHGGGGQ